MRLYKQLLVPADKVEHQLAGKSVDEQRLLQQDYAWQ